MWVNSMAVKIVGMEMPKSCQECRFCKVIKSTHLKARSWKKCLITGFDNRCGKLENDCPLQEVKEGEYERRIQRKILRPR